MNLSRTAHSNIRRHKHNDSERQDPLDKQGNLPTIAKGDPLEPLFLKRTSLDPAFPMQLG